MAHLGWAQLSLVGIWVQISGQVQVCFRYLHPRTQAEGKTATWSTLSHGEGGGSGGLMETHHVSKTLSLDRIKTPSLPSTFHGSK